jgi:hypothetical protein
VIVGEQRTYADLAYISDLELLLMWEFKNVEKKWIFRDYIIDTF